MKIHKLVPLHNWQWYEEFIEGVEQCEFKTPTLKACGTVLCSDESIAERIKILYTKITLDRRVQVVVDSYLPCCALQLKGVPVLLLQMLYADTPQFDNLPDLGSEIRLALTRLAEKTPKKFPSFLGRVFYWALQGIRKNPQVLQWNKLASGNVDLHSVAILLNLLLAFLLGLYPLSSRCTQWNARIHIFRRVHTLLTSSPQKQFDFVQEHMGLILTATIEYICNVLHAFMPVEKDLLLEWMGGGKCFVKVVQSMDNFRCYHIETGEEEWSSWSEAIKVTTENTLRNKRQWVTKKNVKSSVCGPSVLSSPSQLSDFMDVRYLAFPAPQQTTLAEIRLDYEKLTECPVPELRHNMEVTLLPLQIQAMQWRALRAAGSTCDVFADAIRRKPICLQCVAENKTCELRYLQTEGPMQMVCAEHCHSELLKVDMMGKILRIGNVQFVFAPSCNAIRPYTANSHELWKPAVEPPTEACAKPRKECCICEAVNGLGIVTGILDTETLTIKDVWFCHWHRPPDHVLQYCPDLKDVYRVAIEWEARNQKHCRGRRYVGSKIKA